MPSSVLFLISRRKPEGVSLDRKTVVSSSLELNHCENAVNGQRVEDDSSHALRFVLLLYMMRCPHSLQRIGSRGFISFLTEQSFVNHGENA